MKTKHITITEEITIKEIVLIAREKYKVQLAKQLLDKIHESRKLVNNFIHHDQIVYGVTTGVGDNSKIKISSDESQLLQKNIIRSHACGVGEPLKEDQVRAVIVMMIKNLSLGYSGVRYETIKALINLMNCNIVQMVPRDGSLGYLSYQAHISLVLLGEGEAYVNQELLPGNLALQKCGLEAISLHEKEGLSLINGTVDMTSLGALAIYDAQQLLKIADLAGAMSFEALKGNPQAFDARLGKLKPHQGLINTMKNLRALIKDSNIMKEFKNYRVQDALSIRSMPQVHGASKDSLNYIKSTVEIEINAASDNPLLFV